MNVRNVPAGRELDVIVAEKVMGWQPLLGPSRNESTHFQKWYWLKYNSYDPANGYDFYRRQPKDHPWVAGIEFPVPHYSTSLSAAWDVVNKVGGCMVLMYTDNKRDYWDYPHWVCGLGAYEDGPEYDFDTDHVVATTAPLAICRAALVAMGITEIQLTNLR